MTPRRAAAVAAAASGQSAAAPIAPSPDEARLGSGSREASASSPPYRIRTRAFIAAEAPGLGGVRPSAILRSSERGGRNSGAPALLSPPRAGAPRPPSVEAFSAAPRSLSAVSSLRAGLRSALSSGASALSPPPGPRSPARPGRSRAAPLQTGATDGLASPSSGRTVSTARNSVSYQEAAQAEPDAQNDSFEVASEAPAVHVPGRAATFTADAPTDGAAHAHACASDAATAPASPKAHVFCDALTAVFGSLPNVDDLVASVESLVVSQRAAGTSSRASSGAVSSLRPAQALLQAGSHPWETESVASHGFQRGNGALAPQLAAGSVRAVVDSALSGGTQLRAGAALRMRPGQPTHQGSPFTGMESTTERMPSGSVAALVSALSHNARFEGHGASLEDAKKHPGKENKNLSLGLYLLQGTRVGERVFDVGVADGNVYATLIARTRSTSDNRDLPFGIRAPVGHDVLHLLLTLQAELVSLDTFGPVGASVAPVSMPTKAHVSHPSQDLATSHERALQKARLLRAVYSIPVGDAFETHIGLLYAVALDFEWQPRLFEQYIHRSLQALCDAAQECVNDFFRWLRKSGGYVPSALPQLLDLFDEYNGLMDCYREKIIAPFLGPLVSVFLRDQDRRTAHDQRVAAGRREASLMGPPSTSAASVPVSSAAAESKAAPPPLADTRAKGVPASSAPVSPSSSLRRFCSQKERAVASRLTAGCCLEYSTSDGCPR